MRKIVLDTNALLVALPKKSKFRKVFDAVIHGKIALCVTTDILNEYHEILSQNITPEIADTLVNYLLNLNNVLRIDVYYRWDLIKIDYDDNKFVDCAISAGAECIVSDDKHFKVLADVDFPKVLVLKLSEFAKTLK